jgi:hypothetical protein
VEVSGGDDGGNEGDDDDEEGELDPESLRSLLEVEAEEAGGGNTDFDLEHHDGADTAFARFLQAKARSAQGGTGGSAEGGIQEADPMRRLLRSAPGIQRQESQIGDACF